MLQKNDMIYSLDLSGNSIEDYGAEKLCRVLLVNRFLSNLNTIKSLKKTLINSQASSFDPLVEDFDWLHVVYYAITFSFEIEHFENMFEK